MQSLKNAMELYEDSEDPCKGLDHEHGSDLDKCFSNFKVHRNPVTMQVQMQEGLRDET